MFRTQINDSERVDYNSSMKSGSFLDRTHASKKVPENQEGRIREVHPSFNEQRIGEIFSSLQGSLVR